MDELVSWLSSSGLRFEQLLVLLLLGYIFKVQLQQQKQRIWATLEREQRVLMIEEIQRRVRHAEAMVQALCAQLGIEIGGADDARLDFRSDRRRTDRADAGPSSTAQRTEAFRLIRKLRAARAGGLDELAEMCESNDGHNEERDAL